MKKYPLFLILFVCIFLISSGRVCLAETVVFNAKTYKYHSTRCDLAIKCTKNCIKIDKKDAIKLGGTPCKVCNKQR